MGSTAASIRDLYVFLLGICDGDSRMCDALWSVLMGDEQATDAAKAAGVHKGTMARTLARVKANETFQRMTLAANGKATNGAPQSV